MKFQWDENKERINITKHGLDFKTAARVFQDENRIEFYDEEYSWDEDRYITIGMVNQITVIIMLVYTEREDAVRIISARKATKQEKEAYLYGRNEY